MPSKERMVQHTFGPCFFNFLTPAAAARLRQCISYGNNMIYWSRFFLTFFTIFFISWWFSVHLSLELHWPRYKYLARLVVSYRRIPCVQLPATWTHHLMVTPAFADFRFYRSIISFCGTSPKTIFVCVSVSEIPWKTSPHNEFCRGD